MEEVDIDLVSFLIRSVNTEIKNISVREKSGE